MSHWTTADNDYQKALLEGGHYAPERVDEQHAFWWSDHFQRWFPCYLTHWAEIEAIDDAGMKGGRSLLADLLVSRDPVHGT